MITPPNEQFKLLARYTKPHWRMFSLLAVLLTANLALQILNPLIMRHYIDAATNRQPLYIISRIALLFLGVELVTQAIGIMEGYVASKVGWETTNDVRNDLVRHCLKLDAEFHKEHSPGEMIQRIDGDVSELSEFFSRFVVNIIGSGLLICGILLVLWKVDWRIDLLLVLIMTVSGGILRTVQRQVVPQWVAQHQAKAELFGYLEERLGGIDDIRPNGGVDYVVRGLSPFMRVLMNRQRRASVASSWSWTVIMLTLGAFFAVDTTFGWYLYMHSLVTIGTVYMIFHYTMMLIGPVQQLSGQLQGFQQATASLSRVQELSSRSSLIVDGNRDVPHGCGVSVEFDRVSFSYNSELRALDDVSFTIPAGETLGIVGRTGSGKSTLAKLLFRLYNPQLGVVRLDGVDVREYRTASVRRSIGLVTQNVKLIYGTVRDNITLFEPNMVDAQIIEILCELGLGNWFDNLQFGLDTIINAAEMSAGEAQIVSLARVFMRDPSIVILDEPSSRMDSGTEIQLRAAIDRLLEGRTAIVIAHRLETMRYADQIIVLEGGRISESGPREALIADHRSLYSQMVRFGTEDHLV